MKNVGYDGGGGMVMELEGTIHDGVAVPDGECPWPEGTRVRLSVDAPLANGNSIRPEMSPVTDMPFESGQQYPIWSPTEAHTAAAALTAMLHADKVQP